MLKVPRRPARHAELFALIDYLADSADFQNSLLLAIYYAEGAIMSAGDELETLVTSLLATQSSEETTISGLGGALKTLNDSYTALRQQVSDLLAQVSNGANITPAQLENVSAQLGAAQSTAAHQLAELDTLTTAAAAIVTPVAPVPDPVPDPIPPVAPPTV